MDMALFCSLSSWIKRYTYIQSFVCLIMTKAFWFTFDFGQGSVYNLNRGLTEKFGRLLVAFADDYREVEEVTAGNIVVLSGLKASHPRIR
jgi:translation elongation factor EF-G